MLESSIWCYIVYGYHVCACLSQPANMLWFLCLWIVMVYIKMTRYIMCMLVSCRWSFLSRVNESVRNNLFVSIRVRLLTSYLQNLLYWDPHYDTLVVEWIIVISKENVYLTSDWFFSCWLRYLLPEHVGPCSLKITYSAHVDLSVKFQSHRSRWIHQAVCIVLRLLSTCLL